jgi:hypothetical protein
MTMDMLTIRGGMIVHACHLENWFAALSQRRA